MGDLLRVQATDVISRYTQTSFRTLFLFGVGILLVNQFDLNQTEWSIVSNRELSTREFANIAVWIASFLIVMHVLNWMSDYIAFTSWFRKQSAPIDDFFASAKLDNMQPVSRALHKQFASVGEATKELSEATARLKSELSKAKKKADGENTSKFVDIRCELEGCNKKLETVDYHLVRVQGFAELIGPSFRKVKMGSNFMLWGVYLAFPVLLNLYAVAMLNANEHWCGGDLDNKPFYCNAKLDND